MTTEHHEDESDIAVPLTQEERLVKIAESSLRQCAGETAFPIISDWPDGPFRVFVTLAEEGVADMPKTALLFVEFEYDERPFVAYLGADD